MKNILRFVGTALLLCAIIYLLAGFATANLNFIEWTEGLRAIVGFVFAICWIISAIIIYEINN